MNKEEWMGIWGKIFDNIKEEIKEVETLTEDDVLIIGGVMKTFVKALKGKTTT